MNEKKKTIEYIKPKPIKKGEIMKKPGKRILTILSSAALLIGASPVEDARMTAPFALTAHADEEEKDWDHIFVDRCFSSSLKDAVSEDDLLYLTDLFVRKIEPQTVQLLMEKIPPFQEAAERGNISEKIGIYFYDKNVDTYDPEHDLICEGLSSKLIRTEEEGEKILGNIIRIDLSGLLRNGVGGKKRILREDPEKDRIVTLLVHELVHAFMIDYNRAGMLGTGIPELYEKVFDDPATDILFHSISRLLLFPEWFREGIACAIAGNYGLNADILNELSVDPDAEVLTFTAKSVYENYLMHDDYAITSESFYGSYCTSIPAVLYLCELYAKKCGETSVREEEGRKEINPGILRNYLSPILERLHDGETLDFVIADVSDGFYKNTDDYAARFIRGTADPDHDIYSGMDTGSAQFTADLLGYFEWLKEENGKTVDGSILSGSGFDLEDVIYIYKDSDADFYRLTNSGTYEPVAHFSDFCSDGGMSVDGTFTPEVYELAESIRVGTPKEWEEFDIARFNSAGTKDAARMIAGLYYPQNIYKAAKFAEERVDHNAVLSYAALQNPVVADTFSRKDFSVYYDTLFVRDDTVFSLIMERVEEVPPTGTEPGVMAHFTGNDGKKYTLYDEISDEDLTIWLPGGSYDGAVVPGQSLPTGDPGIFRLLAACVVATGAFLTAFEKRRKN